MLLEHLGTPIKTKLNTDCSALGSMHSAQTPAWHAAHQEFNDLVSHSAWSEACPSSWVLHWNNIATRLLAFGKWTKQKINDRLPSWVLHLNRTGRVKHGFTFQGNGKTLYSKFPKFKRLHFENSET